MQIGILEPKNFSAVAIKLLELAGHEVQLFDPNVQQIKNFVSFQDVLFVRLGYQISINFLNNCHNLRYICSPTTGLNHLDEACLKQRGIKVVSLRGETDFLNTIRATPEFSFLLALSLVRRFKESLSQRTVLSSREDLVGDEMFRKRVGIIGYGRVGKLVEKYCTAFDAKVKWFDIDENIEVIDTSNKMNSIESLIDYCEICFLCASYSAEGGVIIGKAELNLLKNKYFIK